MPPGSSGPYAANIGLEVFAEELEAEGVTVIHVDWPPAGGADVAALLARLADE